MSHFPVFVDLRLASICGLDSGWQLSQQSLMKAVARFWGSPQLFSDSKLFEVAEKLYGEGNEHNYSRARIFNQLSLRVRQEGFLCALNTNVAEFVDLPSHAYLPRLHRKKDTLVVDDGHHRLAVLRHLGVERFPVVIVRKEDHPKSSGKYLYTALSTAISEALLVFSDSPVWKEYQKTTDYNLWQPR